MKTTLRGASLKEFITEALQAHLERQTPGASALRGWQSVFGQARQYHQPVVSRDDHFDFVPDLRRVAW